MKANLAMDRSAGNSGLARKERTVNYALFALSDFTGAADHLRRYVS